MAKVAGFAVAQLVSFALGLGVAYAMSMFSGQERATGGIAWGWPVWIAWALILLFVSPALCRYFSHLFGATPDDARKER